MPDPVLLVTGTSSGIGRATAVAAAGAGFTTVATVRNPDSVARLEAAAADASVTLDLRTLDVTDESAVEACVAAVASDHGRLDAVVNNAGQGVVGTVEHLPMAEFRRALEVNFLGAVAVSRAAMPHLRETAGRLVAVSSVGGIVGQPFNEPYCAAKGALEGFMEGLAPVARTVGVKVSIVEPGPVTTQFVANVGADIPAELAAAGPYEPALRGYIDHITAEFSSDAAQTAEEVAAVLVDLLQSGDPPFRVQTSAWATAFVARKLADLDGSAVVGETTTWVS